MPEHVKYFELDGTETHAVLPDPSPPAPPPPPREPLKRHESWAAAAAVVGVFAVVLAFFGWLAFVLMNSGC